MIDAQLSDPPAQPIVAGMGRGTIHPDYQWIADGLKAVGRPQAALATALGWDQPTMSRQLQGKRALKAKELQVIHSFFSRLGHIVPQTINSPNGNLTTTGDHGGKPAEEKRVAIEEGKLDLTIMLIDELKQAVTDLRGRVQTLEQEKRSEVTHDHPKGLRRK